MKHHQNAFGRHAKSKLAGGKPKYMKHNYEKLNPNNISTSPKPHYKPQFSHDQSCFRQRYIPQKNQSMEASSVCAPRAPRNTTSYIIQSKYCGGIPPLINTPSPSQSASTPASVCFNTPRYTEGKVEHVSEEWGVDSYGSMKGLLRVRHNNQQNVNDLEPNIGKCVEILYEKLEQRLDQDLIRVKMNYPLNNKIGPQTLETRINGQDCQIAYLKEESTILKERVHSMEQELDSLQRRMRILEGATSNAFITTKTCSGQASFA